LPKLSSSSGGNLLPDAGAAYLYHKNGGHWGLIEKIVPSDRDTGDAYGWSVAIDGNYVVVGSHFDDEDSLGNNFIINSGSAYIFQLIGKNWNQVQKITALDRTHVAWFGEAVNITGDKIIIGAIETHADSTGTGNIYWGAGSAFIFDNNFTCQPASSIINPSACVNYTSPSGKIYNISNTYQDTVVNGFGCDSIITINLTINQPSNGIDFQTACDSFTWIDGNTYTNSTNAPIFTYTGGAANGCDSAVTLDLTINNTASGIDVRSVCDSLVWIDGNTYTSSTNTPKFTYSKGAANGCDSIVTLDLTVLLPAFGTDVQSACISFTWIDGNTYNNSTNTPTYTYSGVAANGCDSTVTLDLTILSPVSGTDVQTACNSFTWIDGNTYNSSTNSPTFTYPGGAANGCDSTVNLDLTILSNAFGTDVQTACGSIVWIDGLLYNNSTTAPIFSLAGGASNGCDSIVSLDLTIKDHSSSMINPSECI
jgi:hypothetical protein